MTVMTRVLGPEDGPEFRALRLESLHACPSGYSMDPELWAQASAERVAASLSPGPTGFVLGAFSSRDLVGVLGLKINPRPKASHMGTLWGLYVRPEHRRRGVAHALMAALVENAQSSEGVEQLRLMVPEDLQGARALFEAHRFEEYGFEVRGRRTAQGYINLVYMMRFL